MEEYAVIVIWCKGQKQDRIVKVGTRYVDSCLCFKSELGQPA